MFILFSSTSLTGTLDWFLLPFNSGRLNKATNCCAILQCRNDNSPSVQCKNNSTFEVPVHQKKKKIHGKIILQDMK